MVARAGLGAGIVCICDRIARAHHLGVLEARHDVAHLADRELVERRLERTLAADTVCQELVSERHHLEMVALADVPIEDAHRRDDATVLIEVGVEDEGLQGRILVSLRRRDQVDDRLEQVMDALSGLAGHEHGILCRNC